MRRTIKRYDNRKLYDLEAKKYVRLSDLAAMIRRGDEVVVVGSTSGADLTAQTLTKILSGESSGRPFLPRQSLHDLVRWGGDLIGSSKGHVGHWFDDFLTGSIERAAATREIRHELTELRERLATLESLVKELEKGDSNGRNDNE